MDSPNSSFMWINDAHFSICPWSVSFFERHCDRMMHFKDLLIKQKILWKWIFFHSLSDNFYSFFFLAVVSCSWIFQKYPQWSCWSRVHSDSASERTHPRAFWIWCDCRQTSVHAFSAGFPKPIDGSPHLQGERGAYEEMESTGIAKQHRKQNTAGYSSLLLDLP